MWWGIFQPKKPSFMKQLLLTLSIAGLSFSGVHAQIISTIAGNGTEACADGNKAASVRLSGAWAICVDDNGNIFFSEPGRCVVRKIDANGIITTVAGREGISGSAGNGVPATDAELYEPYGLAVDHSGNLFI